MRRRLLIALLATIALLLAGTSPASAGSSNGTTNWYHSRTCYASGGNLNVTNYDIRYNGSTWQEYHIDADRAGGTGAVPKVYIRTTGTTTWRLLSYWNDFTVQVLNWRLMHDFKVVFANGTMCAMGAV
jgi:hypothetical protein